MLLLDGVYVENSHGGLRFHWVNAPSVDELKALVYAISHRVARFLEKRGFLERDAENSYLVLELDDDDAMAQLRGHLRAHHIAIGSHKRDKLERPIAGNLPALLKGYGYCVSRAKNLIAELRPNCPQ